MVWSWITAILNTILPRHPRAETAVALDPFIIASLLAPVTLPRLPWVHALFPYHDERVRALIMAAKYYGEHSIAEKVAPFAADYILELIDHKQRFAGWRKPIIVPIPSSAHRLRERGYNQAAVFAHAIAKHMTDATYAELLTREDRVSQVHVPRAERRANMVGVFEASHHAAGACIILIDDVVESGGTLTDARRALLDEGAQDVIAVAIAH